MCAVLNVAERACKHTVVVLLCALAGCGHLATPRMPWPWHPKSAAPPVEVHELDLTTAGGAPAVFPQYWQNNTLLVDLRRAGGAGALIVKPRHKTTWPVRLAFRIMPGQFGVLELRGDQRIVLPVSTEGSNPMDLEVGPPLYSLKTVQVRVNWEASATVQ